MSTEAWDWKLEPCSPVLDSPSEWSVQEHEAETSDASLESDTSVSVPSRADLAQQLLDDLEEYVKREESFSDWFEEKVPPLPLIFDDLQSVPGLAPEPSLLASNTHDAKEQVTFIKGETNLTLALGHGHLTPPQSPPASDSLSHAPLLVYQQPTYVTLEPSQNLYSNECYLLVPETSSSELAREMAVVDEVVRGVAQQWEQLEYTDSSSRSSDGTEDSDDPEWEPVNAPAASTGRRARQSRPYNVQDRRQRKKEQNKNAATRYRQKKKTEVYSIVEEERGLEDKNTELGTKVKDMEREIVYLKGLMREMFRAKGLIT